MPSAFEHDAFIAYPQPDLSFARKLYNLLNIVGYNVFFAPESLDPGEPWPDRIKAELKKSQVTIVLVSPAFASAYYLKEEVLTAIENVRRDSRRKIIPIYLTWQGELSDLPDPLIQLHRLSLDDENDIFKLAQRLHEFLQRSKGPANWDAQFDARTIALVTGCHYRPEVDDRPAAYQIQKEIEESPCPLDRSVLRAVVFGDKWFLECHPDHRNVISIGSATVNALTGRIAETADCVAADTNGKWRILRSENRWAVFGNLAEDTQVATKVFREKDLDKVLHEAWQQS